MHPEQPLRIKEIYEKHQEFGLLDRVKHVESRKATGLVFSECIFLYLKPQIRHNYNSIDFSWQEKLFY